MSNLLIKTLFISLLSSAVIPFSIQAGVTERMRSAGAAAATGVGRMGKTLAEVVTTLAERARIEVARDAARTAGWARRKAIFEIRSKVATEVEGVRRAVMKARTAAAKARSVAAKMVTARADLALGVGM